MNELKISRTLDGTKIIIKLDDVDDIINMEVDNTDDYYSDVLKLENGKKRTFKLEEK